MSRPQHSTRERNTQRRELHLSELTGIMEKVKPALSEADYCALMTAVDTLAFLTRELEAKGTSIERLRKLLFGSGTEKTRKVLADAPTGEPSGTPPSAEDASSKDETPPEKKKAPGHGKNGAASYTGANQVDVPHAQLSGGAPCPDCQKGKVYASLEPQMLLRVRGVAPLSATRYACDRLRCNLCGEVFTAEPPAGIGSDKYDETAASMIGLLKYGAGVPFNRIEKLEGSLGIPLPASTQWELVEGASKRMAPAHAELVREAAQGEVLHNDDTTVKILELAAENTARLAAVTTAPRAASKDGSDVSDARTGIFTTGIVARRQDHTIALFFSGRKHAGENLNDVLALRAAELSAPIQMCDALSRNLPPEFKTVLSNCLAHARRYFVDVVPAFPVECRHLLEELGKVYKNDATARAEALSPAERLRFHKEHSVPIMNGLHVWLCAQIDERRVEPNSGLGEAIGYMRKHWKELTLFLRVAGAPIDNNVCERALKKAILHRKNAMFFKTQNGADVGDRFMSLIHTAELNRANPFDYLVALQRHHERVAANPSAWMPWNYAEALAAIPAAPSTPS